MANYDVTLDPPASSFNYTLRLSVNTSTNDPSNNRTLVTWSLSITKGGGSGVFTASSASWAVRFDGSNVGSGSLAGFDFRNYTTLTLGSGSTWVTHNTNGSKTISVQGIWSPTDGTLPAANTPSPAAAYGLPDYAFPPSAPAAPTVTRSGVGTSATVVSAVASSAVSPSDYEYRLSTDNSTWGAAVSMGLDRTATATGLAASQIYYFQTRAVSSEGVGAWSVSTSSDGIPSAPGTPTGVSGTDAFGKVVLSWTAPTTTFGTVTGYNVYGTTGGVETLVRTTTGTGVSNIAITGLAQRSLYTFRVAARNAFTDANGTEGLRSSASTSIQASAPPTAPTSLTAAVPVPEVAQRLTLNWTAPSNDGDPNGGITGYRIFYSTGVLIASVNGTSTTYNVDGLIPGQEYGFYVQARNAISDVVGTHSANSNVAYATPVGAPDQVTGLSATPVSSIKGAVLLMWDEKPFSDGYLVYRNTTPTLTLLQRIPGAVNNTYVHYLDRTATSYSSQSYVVSAYNEFAPGGGPVSSPASTTPNVTVLQATPSTATSNLTNQNVYSGDFSIVSLTADTFTYARTASNLAESSVPATFGTVINLTNDDISGTYTISVTGSETPFFSYTKAPDVGVGDIPSETVAVSSTAVNNTNPIFNGEFTVDSLDGTDGIIYIVSGTNPTISEVAATGTIVNQSNTTFNVTTQITDVTSSTVSFAAPGAADEATSAAEGVVTNTTNRDVFNDNESVVVSAPAHNVLVYELPGTPESTGTRTYTYSNVTTTGDPGSGALRFDSTTPASITTLRIDDLDSGAVDRSAWYETWDDYAGSEPVFGILSINVGGPAPLLLAVAGAVVDSTGYYTVPVQYVSGTLPASGTSVAVTFYPYVSAEVLSPYGAVRKANSTAKLEIRYRSGWLA